MKKLLTILLLPALLFSCKKDQIVPDKTEINPPSTPVPTVPVTPPSGGSSLDNLPKDTGGTQQPHYAGSDNSPYGYYIYTPSGYTSSGPKFPVLIFLHGSGEIGNSHTYPDSLGKVITLGPPSMIQAKTWNPKYPMIVVSPQSDEDWWDPNRLNNFITFIKTTYQVDDTRIYVTGLSMGGSGIYDLLSTMGTDAHIAAAVPIVGGGFDAKTKAPKLSGIPLWAFHSEGDLIIPDDFDKEINQEINALNPSVKAKLTMYPVIDHEIWAETYDGTGMGKEDPAYDAFSMDIYTWMFQYSTPAKL